MGISKRQIKNEETCKIVKKNHYIYMLTLIGTIKHGSYLNIKSRMNVYQGYHLNHLSVYHMYK